MSGPAASVPTRSREGGLGARRSDSLGPDATVSAAHRSRPERLLAVPRETPGSDVPPGDAALHEPVPLAALAATLPPPQESEKLLRAESTHALPSRPMGNRQCRL